MLDAYKTTRGLDKLTFTSVGVWNAGQFPDAAAFKDIANKVRMVAYPRLVQIAYQALAAILPFCSRTTPIPAVPALVIQVARISSKTPILSPE
jgi:hypothetical protein